MKYNVKRMATVGDLAADWDGDCWSGLNTLELTNFRPEGSDHKPFVQARLGHDGEVLYGIFRVEDRYVRSIRTGFHSDVCRDSCVEFFVQPAGGDAYLNFEFNAGGAMLCHYVEDPRRNAAGPLTFVPLDIARCRQIGIISSLESTVDPEITDPVIWTLAYSIPKAVLAYHVGDLGPLSGQTWRANFYKCGDETSHPHWGSWMPVSEVNFHLPGCFGDIEFE